MNYTCTYRLASAVHCTGLASLVANASWVAHKPGRTSPYAIYTSTILFAVLECWLAMTQIQFTMLPSKMLSWRILEVIPGVMTTTFARMCKEWVLVARIPCLLASRNRQWCKLLNIVDKSFSFFYQTKSIIYIS